MHYVLSLGVTSCEPEGACTHVYTLTHDNAYIHRLYSGACWRVYCLPWGRVPTVSCIEPPCDTVLAQAVRSSVGELALKRFVPCKGCSHRNHLMNFAKFNVHMWHLQHHLIGDTPKHSPKKRSGEPNCRAPQCVPVRQGRSECSNKWYFTFWTSRTKLGPKPQ